MGSEIRPKRPALNAATNHIPLVSTLFSPRSGAAQLSAADGGKRENYIWLFSVTVQVIPAAINTPAGTLVMRMRTGIRCANLTQVKVGLTLASSSGPFLLS